MALVGGSFCVYRSSLKHFREEALARAELLANAINYASETLTHFEDRRRVVSALGGETDVKLIMVVGGKPSRVLACTSNVLNGKLLEELSSSQNAQELLSVIQTRKKIQQYRTDEDELVLVHPLLLSSANYSDASLYQGAVLVVLDTTSMQLKINALAIQFGFWTLATVGIIIGLVYFLLNHLVIKKTRDIYQTISKRMAGDQKAYSSITTRDEIGVLAQTLNNLFHTLLEKEKELKKLVKVIDHTDNGVVITNSKGEVEWVNRGFTRISEYTLSELKGRKPGSILQGPASDSKTVAYMNEQLRQNKGFQADIINYSKMGRLYWVAIEVQPLYDDEGKLINFMAIESDITRRKQTEQELIKAKEVAQSADRAKSLFLASMSHEIRTPMNGIIGFTSLLLDSSLKPEHREYVEIIRNSGEALLTIINDILDFSKIESGNMELEMQQFDLRSCIEETLDLFTPKAMEKKLELAYSLSPDTPQSIVGDVTRLRQIVTNLVGNALKFTEAGEVEVSVRTMPGKTPTLTRKGMLQFSVRDTGVGIPQDKQHRLFKAFSQADSSTTRRYGGTGLGLAISKRLCELMGGTMWIASKEGKGSTFCFTIQACLAPAKKHYFLEQNPPDLHGKNLLIVDDTAINRRILRSQVEHWGMLSQEASSAHEALQTLSECKQPFDLCLLDYLMPCADGLQLIEAIRKQWTPEKLPVIVLTSSEQEMVRRQIDRLGISHVLQKPIKTAALYRVITEALNTSRLPQGEKSEEKEPEKKPLLAHERPLSILLAEDNRINQLVAQQLLGRLGYRIDMVANGFEAIKALQVRPYNVILMDVQMPEMNGMETTRRIRKEFPQDQQPWVIALTAEALKGDRENCLLAGMNDYLSKPINLDGITKVLTAVPDSFQHALG